MKAILSGVLALAVLAGGALWWINRGGPESPLAFDNPRARLVTTEVPMAGYLTITNHTDRQVRLIGASGADFDRVMIHETRISDGRARMTHRRDGIGIAPGERVELAPGGLHLMLMGAQKAFNVGDSTLIVLEFDGIEPRQWPLELIVVPVTG